MMTSQEFFDLSHYDHQGLFSENEGVWTALDHLKDYLASIFLKPWPLSGITGQINKAIVIYDGEVRDDLELTVGRDGSPLVSLKGEILAGAAVIFPGAFLANDKIIIGAGTIVESGAFIRGPAIIGSDTEIRQGAYIRGDCLVGKGCVVGHTTEIKGSIMMDGAKAGHFAYIGDSILGKDVNLGAGTKLANLKMLAGSIIVTADKKKYDTGRRKLGAILGDRTETGCNSVTSPGTFMGPGSIVFPAVAVPGGYYPGRTIVRPSRDSLRISSMRP
jgi:UDP-N-acetylglucosamine diphosphorylase / glucose-1-phosphate thymidylyltransferase / UDP-N-acetylgalactosamine diphosphorylase / glucosamine-1-phosphate N-acetyltransferase / galactosamine-1-phosphate N-acetyltransferase